jgi:hypothetical protein
VAATAFIFSSGYSSSSWQFHGGDLAGEDLKTSASYVKFNYSFHLPIADQFGYLLGSSVGYGFAGTTPSPRFNSPPTLIEMPGLVAGLLYNLAPSARIQLWSDLHLTRVSRIKSSQTSDGGEATLHVTMETIDMAFAVDLFFKLQWALRIEAANRRSTFLRPGDASGSPVDIKLNKSGYLLGIGVCYNYF